jgi:hypothetical protein
VTVTLAQTIERLLAGRPLVAPGIDLSYSDFEKEFLRRWANALKTKPEWKDRNGHVSKITKPLALVSRAIKARRWAVKDNVNGEDSFLRRNPEHEREARDLAEMATKLAAHYRWQAETLAQVDDLETNEADAARQSHEMAKWSALIMDDCKKRHAQIAAAYALTEPKPLFRQVYVSNKPADRERMLFMQRMSAAMMATEGDWNDVVVAAITSVMYEVSVSEKSVTKQREQMSKATTPVFLKTV